MDKRLFLDSVYAGYDGCPSHSLGYYIGYIRNGTDCDQLPEADVTETLQVSGIMALSLNSENLANVENH